MLIPPMLAYPQQQTPRIPQLPYTTERNQEQRHSQRSISPTHKRADESEDDEFLDSVIPGMTMQHLPLHVRDIESAQRRLEKVLVRCKLFIGVNQYTRLPVKGVQVSKSFREIQEK
ncbi:MAG: hypothetical protein EZS28_037666 [Streblomastix strix]|uniref:Uncharacterized protein n=1 Tax=Streblomastix strix TaxID=222440 RepID=A0A5J4U8S4_9EUKA|nr:MAG: hypothetical protein EZS28_037666 [Streblomastix strix]